jgi:hypothetical protein
MTTDALKAFFALLETEEEDLPTLMQRFGIDPATDLQNCDLSEVDFGSLKAHTLNLAGSYLGGADLSKVNCEHVIGIEGSAGLAQSPKRNALDDALIAISRYQNADWSISQIVSRVDDSYAPVLAFYDSTAEQDILTKRICAHYGDASHLREGFNSHAMGKKLLWFYSKGSKGSFKLNPALLDRAFFEALRATSSDIGIYPLRPNQAAIERIIGGIRSIDYNIMAKDFARGLRNELAADREGGFVTYPGGIVLFSGFPPISKRLHQQIREAVPGRINLIFLCSSSWEPMHLQDQGLPWRRLAIPAYSIGEPLATEADVRRLAKRIEMASGGKLIVAATMMRWMDQFVGKPLVALKERLAVELKSAFPLGTRGAPPPREQSPYD